MICGNCGGKFTPLVGTHVCAPEDNENLYAITEDCKNRLHPPNTITGGWIGTKWVPPIVDKNWSLVRSSA